MDNGIGMKSADLKKIFDKFYRVAAGDIHKVRGLGIGLFTARRIVEAHNGTITVSSKPGKGSNFTIQLPVADKTRNPVSQTNEG
jgi:signal transduction histidine kinase